jgi:2'-hydroxyisoflavone reductase
VTHGPSFRPLADAAPATLDWFRSQPPERQAQLRAGSSAERGAEVRATWEARQG